MFGAKYTTRISYLEKENERLRDELRAAKEVIESINNEITSAKPMIDFDTMRVFSIERLVHNNKPATIIGHYVSEPVVEDGEAVTERDKIKEWTLYCDNARHNELVNEFKEWKAKQNG